MSFDVSPLVDLHYAPQREKRERVATLALRPSFANRTVVQFATPVLLTAFEFLIFEICIFPSKNNQDQISRNEKDKMKYNTSFLHIYSERESLFH